MPVVPIDDQATAILQLLDYPSTHEVRAAFLRAILMLPVLPGVSIAAESHGVMRSLGIFRGDEWCFSLAPAQQWIKVWVRRPELNRRPKTGTKFEECFPGVETTGGSELTARLRTEAEMLSFVEVVRRSV